MAQAEPLVISMGTILLGLLLLSLALFLVRVFQKKMPLEQVPLDGLLPIETENHAEGIILIQSGGRIGYMNRQAREWFGTSNGKPNLEHMARLTRPENAFFSLCSLESQSNFSIGGNIVEGTSFSIPYGPNQARVITLKRPQFVLELEEGQLPGKQALLSDHIFDIFDKLSQSVATSSNLESTLTSILESLERLLPSDTSQIKLYNPEQTILTTYNFADIPGNDRKLSRGKETFEPGSGITGHLISTRHPLLIPQVDEYVEQYPQTFEQDIASQSYMGAPLLVANELIGTIELASLNENTYSANDLELLKMFSGQAAVAIHNAIIHTEKRQRSTEMTSLVSVAQAVSSMSDARDLYNRLVEAISPLLDVEILGFLIFDENRKVLEAQIPFQGISPSIIEWMTISIAPDSPAEKVWSSQKTIVTDDAISDTRIQALGFDHLAQAAGLVHCVLAPLTSSGRLVGYLLVADKRDGSGFEGSDVRLIEIIAGQTAPIIENSSLMHQSQKRAQRAETLRRIASLIGSSATLDEILKYSLQDLARLLRANQAAIYLINDHNGELRLHADSLFGVPFDRVSGLDRITDDDPQFRRTVTKSTELFFSNNLIEDTRVLPLSQPLIDAFNIRSAIIVPLMVRNRGVGELMIGSTQENYFQLGDIQSTETVASQLSTAIEKASLYSQTDDSLRRRLDQLISLTHISRELNRALDLESILELVYEEALRTTNADCGAIFLLEFTPGDKNQTNYAQPKTPDISQFYGDIHDTGLHPLEEIVLEKVESMIINDYDKPENIGDAGSPDNDNLQPVHEGIHSSLIVPIIDQKRATGIIHLHARTPNNFDQDSIDITEEIASQAAIAIQNARLYAETSKSTQELDLRVQERTEQLTQEAQRTKILLKIITELSASLDLKQVLNRTLAGLNEVVKAKSVLVAMGSGDNPVLEQIAYIGDSLPLPAFQKTLKDVMRKQELLLINDVSSNSHWAEAPEGIQDQLSLLSAPLLFGEESLGAILFTHPHPNQFSSVDMDLIAVAANQIAIAVNNAELFELIRDQAENMGKMARNQQIETQRTRAILEDVADGVLVTDEHMNITLFNDSAETILGLKRSEVLGKTLEHFSGVFGRVAHSWMETIRIWSQDPSAYRTGETFAEQILLEDGHVVSVHLAPVDLDEVFMGTVSVFRDITHIVEVDQLKSEFVATVSHELRTPMTSIKGYVDILLMGAAGSLNKQQTDFLEIVKNNTDRLAILVNDLLDISRIEAKKLNLSMQPLDVIQIAEEAITDLKERSLEENKKMHIIVDRPTNLPRILGDAERVRQIIDNLLENAYLYTPENGHITLRVHCNEHDIQIDVQDDGIGIPPNIQERVFERFFRGEHAFVLASAGTGLGLSIVQHLVELHDGRIWLNSAGKPGEGSTFSFTMPIYPPENG